VEAGLTKRSQCKWKFDWWKNNSNFNTKRRFHATPPICCWPTGLGFGKMRFGRLMLFWQEMYKSLTLTPKNKKTLKTAFLWERF